MATFEAVIGLEVHVQLATKSKLFCSCSTTFGQPSNSNVCEVCAGMPGALPSINRTAVRYATMAGLATNCSICQDSIFARKNYFYPDLPAGYQISQFEAPICSNGYLDIDVDNGKKRIGITRIHMENDAGKNIHSQGQNSSFVDLNRAGTPLIEIVSEPDLRSAQEAVAYLKTLYGIVTFLGICDGNMEEGSFRCDANVSIRPVGSETFGTRTELKNLNSFRNVQRAIEIEIARQEDVLADGGKIIQETRLYDAVKNSTASMREKEEAHDYRYFPDPDLLPVHIEDAELAEWKKTLPELPQARLVRFRQMANLPDAELENLLQSRQVADFFEEAAKNSDARKVATLILGPFLRELHAQNDDFSKCAMTPANLAELVSLVKEGSISDRIANEIFPELFQSGKKPSDLVKEKGLVQISDSNELDSWVDAVIQENPADVVAYKSGKTKVLNLFMGQVMRKSKGKANPALVNELLLKKLAD